MTDKGENYPCYQMYPCVRFDIIYRLGLAGILHLVDGLGVQLNFDKLIFCWLKQWKRKLNELEVGAQSDYCSSNMIWTATWAAAAHLWELPDANLIKFGNSRHHCVHVCMYHQPNCIVTARGNLLKFGTDHLPLSCLPPQCPLQAKLI